MYIASFDYKPFKDDPYTLKYLPFAWGTMLVFFCFYLFWLKKQSRKQNSI